MSESQRLQAARELDLIGSAPEERFDRIARLAARVFGCTSAAIGLMDDSRIWFKSAIGTAIEQLPRRQLLADRVVEEAAPLIISDARDEPELRHCASVTGPPHLRFYAGHPLTAAGSAIGVLCVFHPEPLQAGPEQLEMLAELAALAEAELQRLDADQIRRRLEETGRRYRALVESNPDPIYTIDTTGRVTSCNEALSGLTGYPREALIGKPFGPLLIPEEREAVQAEFRRCLAGEPVHVQTTALRADGARREISVTAAPYRVDGQLQGVVGVSRDVTSRVLAEQRLRESEQRLALALASSRQGAWEWDLAAGTVYQSPQLRELLGEPAVEYEEPVDHWKQRIHPEDRPCARAASEAVLGKQNEYSGEYRLRCADGRYRWFSYHGKVIARTADGRPRRLIGIIGDVHEQHLVRQERQREAKRMALAVEAGGIGVFEEDLASQRFDCDSRACYLFGLRAEARSVSFTQMLAACHPDDRGQLEALHQAVHRGERDAVEVEFRVVTAEGYRHLRVLGTVLEETLSAPRTLIGTCWEVTEARELQHRLLYQANHDPLTGLYNRRKFERRLASAQDVACSPGHAHWVCFVDLDRFKIINDTLGHVAGDALLRELARLLDASVVRPHTLARLGGDEFGLLLMEQTLEQAEQVALGLIHQIDRFIFRWEGRSYGIGASIGIAELAGGAAGIVEAMSQADVACYTAKTSRRGRISVYRPGAGEAEQRHQELRMVKAVREALAEDRLRLHAQEIRPTQPGAMGASHYELLVRMLGAGGELVSPGLFIPAAELYGLMVEVDRWVLREALQRQGERIAARPELVVSINLSAQSLDDPQFVPFVLELLADSPVPARQVQFEITETAAMANLEAAARVIQVLRGLGCTVALDDFGAGSSSFAYLRQFAVDCIKIDGSFIKTLGANATDRIIVESIHQLARRLGARTVAEYVENDTLLAQVRAIGIDYVQGYGIARPRPLHEVL